LTSGSVSCCAPENRGVSGSMGSLAAGDQDTGAPSQDRCQVAALEHSWGRQEGRNGRAPARVVP
jgi:hypothetical protein